MEDFKRLAFEEEGTFPNGKSTNSLLERNNYMSNKTLSDLRKFPQDTYRERKKHGFDSI